MRGSIAVLLVGFAAFLWALTPGTAQAKGQDFSNLQPKIGGGFDVLGKSDFKLDDRHDDRDDGKVYGPVYQPPVWTPPTYYPPKTPPPAVPEPASLFAIGLIGLGALRRRRG